MEGSEGSNSLTAESGSAPGERISTIGRKRSESSKEACGGTNPTFSPIKSDKMLLYYTAICHLSPCARYRFSLYTYLQIDGRPGPGKVLPQVVCDESPGGGDDRVGAEAAEDAHALEAARRGCTFSIRERNWKFNSQRGGKRGGPRACPLYPGEEKKSRSSLFPAPPFISPFLVCSKRPFLLPILPPLLFAVAPGSHAKKPGS